MSETFVHVWLVTVEPETTGEIVERIRETATQARPVLHGLKSASILVSEDRTRVALITEWEGAHDWGRAQWDTHIQDAVVGLFRTANHVDSHLYRNVFHYTT